jgi:hypothetical protein
MLAIARIALAEFAKAFAFRVGTPAARDFLWLTVFFTLSAFIVFVGWSAREGVWDRFEQVLLGALPEGGPPIRITTHIDLRSGITPEVIDKFEKDFPNLGIVPMREFDGQVGSIVLPGLAFGAGISPQESELSWGRAADGATAKFRSFALPIDSPLWRWIRQRSGEFETAPDRAPLVIAANRSLFQKHFRYDKYRRAIASDVSAPCLIRSSLEDKISDPGQLDTLVLKVREWSDAGGNREAYQSFKVIWVDSFPLPEQVAFIMPLQTAELAMAAETWKEFNLYFEGRGAATQRVSELRLKDIDALGEDARAGAVRDFTAVASCLGSVAAEQIEETTVCGAHWEAEVVNDSPLASENAKSKRRIKAGDSQNSVVPVLAASSFDLSITTSPQWPMREADVRRCIQRTRFADALRTNPPPPSGPGDAVAELTPESAAVVWKGPSRIELPCSVLTAPGPTQKLLEHDACATAQSEDGRGVGRLTGYSDAMIYAGGVNRAAARASGSESVASESLDDTVKNLLAWKIGEGRTAFRLDAAYESALVRFGVLSTIIDKMAVPLGGGMLLLYLVLSGVILATTFLHRRPQYGLLFMNGVRPWGLEMLVLMQIAISCTIGCVIGYAGFWAVATATNGWLKASDIIRKAAFIIGLDVPSFLDNLPASSIVWIWIAMSFAGFAIGAIILRIQGISTAKAPIDLIKS